MKLYYYIIQLFTIAESVSVLLLIRTLLYGSGSKFEFKNRDKILKYSAVTALFSANILIIISCLTEGMRGTENTSVTLALLIDLMALLISVGSLITILMNGKDKRIKKEKAETVTIRANELNFHSNIRPVPYLQTDEKETLQTAVWKNGTKQKVLIFTGGAVTGTAPDSEITAELVPHNTEPDTYYVTRSVTTGKKTYLSYITNIIQASARLMFVISMMYMNIDHIVLKMDIPYPEGYPSIGLMGASMGVLIMSYAWITDGKGKTAAGSTAISLFRMIAAVITILGFLSMINSFLACITLY